MGIYDSDRGIRFSPATTRQFFRLTRCRGLAALLPRPSSPDVSGRSRERPVLDRADWPLPAARSGRPGPAPSRRNHWRFSGIGYFSFYIRSDFPQRLVVLIVC